MADNRRGTGEMIEQEVKIPADKIESIKLVNPSIPFLSKLKSIKLMLTFIFTLLFTTLLIMKYITETAYVSMITILLLSSFGGDVASKYAGKK